MLRPFGSQALAQLDDRLEKQQIEIAEKYGLVWLAFLIGGPRGFSGRRNQSSKTHCFAWIEGECTSETKRDETKKKRGAIELVHLLRDRSSECVDERQNNNTYSRCTRIGVEGS